jgi:hypothetical protein
MQEVKAIEEEAKLEADFEKLWGRKSKDDMGQAMKHEAAEAPETPCGLRGGG